MSTLLHRLLQRIARIVTQIVLVILQGTGV